MAATRQAVLSLIEGSDATKCSRIRGGKGAGLAAMADLGLPVPPAFTLTTSVHRAYMEHGRLPKRVLSQLERNIISLELESGRSLGSAARPLLVSVRSGAKDSMPGMMDTILNVGINQTTVLGLAENGGETFAYDTYRRFLMQFGQTVMGVPRIDLLLAAEGTQSLDPSTMCDRLRFFISDYTGMVFPEDPREQITLAIKAVFDSWNSERAVAYRVTRGLANWEGTAVNVQAMVFGNLDDKSGTGVVFTCDPNTGAPGLYGEFLPQAQGEDIVAGTSTPLPVSRMIEWNESVYEQLVRYVTMLSEQSNDMVDVEFTVQSGELFILQTRRAARSALAATTFAVRQVWAKKWNQTLAVQSVSADQVAALTGASLAANVRNHAIADGLRMALGVPASAGAVTGRVAFNCADAQKMAAEGIHVILVRDDTAPEDLPGMLAAKAIVTANGGVTCHAAVVARQLGIPAIVGVTYAGSPVSGVPQSGELVTVDGSTGNLLRGALPLVATEPTKEVNVFLRWVGRFVDSAPRIGFEYVTQLLSANQFLGDFYLLEAMADKAMGNHLARKIFQLQSDKRREIAESFAAYLAIAISGEVRHYRADSGLHSTLKAEESAEELNQLLEYSIQRDDSQQQGINVLRRLDLASQVRFAGLIFDIFRCGRWDSAFGGSKWAAIADALRLYLNGEVKAAVFIDHVFDLRHNGGVLFNKHPMFTARTDESTLRRQLEVKKTAKSLAELYSGLQINQVNPFTHTVFSAEVEALWQQGKVQGLW